MANRPISVAVALVGREALWGGGRVVVVDYRAARGRVEVKVRDGRGHEAWVRVESVEVVETGEGGAK